MKTTGKKILMGVMIFALALCWVTAAVAGPSNSHYFDLVIDTADTDYCMFAAGNQSGVRLEDGCYGSTTYGNYAGARDEKKDGVYNMNDMTNNSAFGFNAVLQDRTDNATAIGAYSHAMTTGATSIGARSYATATNSTALGYNANASYKNSVAIGANSATIGENEVSFGNADSGLTRKLTNVAVGVADTDAVTVGQLNSVTGNALKNVAVSDTGMLSQTTVAGTTSNVAQLQDTTIGSMKVDTVGDQKILTVTRINNYTKETVAEFQANVTELVKNVEIVGSLGNVSASNGIVMGITKNSSTGREDIDFHMGEDFKLTDEVSKNYTNYRGSGVQVSTEDESLQASLSSGQLKFTNGENTATLSTDGLTINGKTYVSDAGLNANDKAIKNVAAGELSATSTEAVNGSQLYAEQEARKTADATLQTNIDKETSARIEADQTLQNSITAETARATSVETGLQNQIIEADQTLQNSINAETARATSVETGLQNQINDNRTELREVGAMSAALAGLHYVEPTGEGDDKFTGAVSFGGYRGASAGAIGVAYKPTTNLMVSAATSFGNSNNSYNAGISYKFGKGNTAATREALQKQVNSLQQEVKELKELVNKLIQK